MNEERILSYLAGAWVDGSAPGTQLINPTTEEVLASADSTGIDIPKALEYGRTVGGASLRALSFEARGALLKAMSETIHAAREPLIESAIANGGCTRSDAKFDIDGAIGTLAAYAKIGASLGARSFLADGDGIQLARGPRFWGQHILVPRRGIAVLINAFNFPAWGFAEKAACALLAGMPVLNKPAPSTALTAYLLTKAIVDAGILPEGAVSFLAGEPGDLVGSLYSQDILAFTGSAATGRKLRSMPSIVERSVPVNVEADSLNCAVLGPDAELGSELMNLYLHDVVREMTQKSGQKCTAVRRIIVPEALFSDVQEELVARLGDIRVGDPTLRESRMGPIVTQRQLNDVVAGIGELSADAECLFGEAGRPDALVGIDHDKGFFQGPVLLRARDAGAGAAVHHREVFGPVSTILTYSGRADDAVALAAFAGGGLVASAYSDDRGFAEEMMFGLAPHHGRVYLGSEKVADHATGPGVVLPSCVHGGPGRAGGGEELGGERGLRHYMQRVAVQGYRSTVEKLTGTRPA